MNILKKRNLLVGSILFLVVELNAGFRFMAPEPLSSSAVALTVELSDGVTNRIEIYSCSNLLSNEWKAVSGILSYEGTNCIFWTDEVPGEKVLRYYRAGNADLDSDGDSLPDARELYVHGTAIDLADSDADGLPDGEEVRWGHTSPSVFDDVLSDVDHDGLSLALEYAYATNPNLNDTDQDGVLDGVEAGQGSNPTDVADGGVTPALHDLVEVDLSISGIHPSEFIVLRLGNLRVLGGVVDMHTFKLKKGILLESAVEFCGSQSTIPVYAYNASVSAGGGNTNEQLFVDDPDQVLGEHSGVEYVSGSEGKVAGVMLPKFELTISVDQPVGGSRSTKYLLINGKIFTGHSWWNISVEPASFIETFVRDADRARFLNVPGGYYPENSPNSDLGKYQMSVPAELRCPDFENRFIADVVRSFPADWSGVNRALDRVAALDAAPGTFDLNIHNCSDVVLEIAALCGHILPDTKGNWAPYGGGTNPADLGEDLRVLTD